MSPGVLEIRHLRLVRAIADEGGPTRAAARLHLTQSAVSHQLAELEHRLGVPLFARVRRRLVPTAAGARLIDEARLLLGELGRVERELHRAGERTRDVVSVVTETFTSYAWLPDVMAAVARVAPAIELCVALAATRDPCAALLRGTVDVALVCTPVRDPALVATPLFTDAWAVLLRADAPLATRAFVGADALGRQTVIAHDAPRADVERLREIVAEERVSMPRVTTVPLTSLLVDFVRAGIGVGLVSRWAVAADLARGDLVAKPFTRTPPREQWSAVRRRDASAERLDPVVDALRAVAPMTRSSSKARAAPRRRA